MEKELKKIAQQVESCRKCSLYKGAKQAVPGQGTAKSGVVFIGEAPGQQEDRQGIPFCGSAGKLLDQLLEEAKLDRKKVFIGNVLKHRPPNNRDPEPAEIKACFPFLIQQLNCLKPKLIIPLGRYALSLFLPDYSISQIHGQPKRIDWQRSPYFKDQEMYSQKIVILPQYHPAAALYRGTMKDILKEDFRKIPLVLKRIAKE